MPLPPRRVALVALALAVPALSAPATASAAKPKYTKKGHRAHPAGGSFRIEFSGQGTWTTTYDSTQSGNNLSTTEHRVDSSTFTWRSESKELMNLPWPCRAGESNLCALISGQPLVRGTQTLSLTVNDTRVDSVTGPETKSCSQTVGLDSSATPVSVTSAVIGVRGTKQSQLVVSSVDSSGYEPFLGTTDPSAWLFGITCHGLDGADLWEPTNTGLSTAGAPDFFVFKAAPVPLSALASSRSVAIPVSGPLPQHEPKPNCGIDVASGVTCKQDGTWRGKVVFTRASR